METIDVHELEITGVFHQQADRTLILLGKQKSGINTYIIFAGVEWWELCSFGIQNVLTSIEGYKGDSLTDALVVEHDIPAQYQQSIRAGQPTLYVLTERIGFSGLDYCQRRANRGQHATEYLTYLMPNQLRFIRCKRCSWPH